MELLERSSVEAVLCCCTTGGPAVSLLPRAASAATRGVPNARGIFCCGVGRQQQTLHTRSRTAASSQRTATCCVLQQGIPTENTAGGRLMVAEYSAGEKNCSFLRCRCHRSSLDSTSRFARSISRSPPSPPSSSCPSALDVSSSSPRSSKSGPSHVRFSFSMSVPPLVAAPLEKAQHALSRDSGIQSSSSVGCSLSTSPHLRLQTASDAETDLSDGTRHAVPFTIPSAETTRRVGPLDHVIGGTVVGARTDRSAAVGGRLREYLQHISDHMSFSCPSSCTCWVANHLENVFLKPFLRELQQRHPPRERSPSWQQQKKYMLEWQQRQQRPWEQHHWEQQQQRRWYTPPSRRNWSKQHSRIFTRRPLTDNFALGRLHPELEWFRERASQPVSLFMGFPDLEKVHVRGGASYINEMDAATLSIVLAAMSSQGRTSVASPAHLLQHNSPLIEQLGTRAAVLAATAPDATLAYLFRGCAGAGVSDWATVCTLVGYIDTRLPRFSLHDVLVVLQGIRLARSGSLQYFVEDADIDRVPLSPVYTHPPFVDRVVRHLELLLQHRDDVLPAELCAAATLLAGIGYASAARMQFVSGLLAQVPQQQLALTPPRALAAAMEVFAWCRAELNTDCSLFSETNCRALSPLLRAAAAPPGLEPSPSQLTLIFLVAPLLHRLQTGSGGGDASAAHNGRRARRSCRAGGASPAAAAGGSAAAAALKALTEAAATAAAATVEERSEVRRRGSLLRHAVGICLAWTYERLENLSVHHITKVLYAATAARLYPRGSLMEDLFKTSLEHLGACTPADISRLFYAILHAGEPRPSADPVLLQARCLTDALMVGAAGATSQERIQRALDVSLEMCSSSTLVRVHSAIARALRSSTLTLSTLALHAAPPSQRVLPASSDTSVSMGLLAQKAAVVLSARLFRARPGDLATFLVGLRTVETDNSDVAEKIIEILDRRLQLLEPQQLASLLVVLADPPQQHRVRWRESRSRLLTFLKMSLEERRQQWQPETLSEECKGPIRPVVAAVCDRLAGAGGSHTYIERKDLTEQGLRDGREASADKFSESLVAISKQGMPADELRLFSYQRSPLHTLGIGDLKQLLNALQVLQVRHKHLQEVVTHVVTMKRYDFKNKRHIQVATTVRAW